MQPSQLAVGTYSGSLAIFDASTLSMEYLMHGHKGGVTHLRFTNCGNYLLSGARQDPEILCWDVRFTSDVLYRLQRDTAATNQRIQFDIEPSGRHLATGGADGRVRVFDLQTGLQVDTIAVAEDTVSGCQFHPYLPLLATVSGHRQALLQNIDNYHAFSEQNTCHAQCRTCQR